MTTPTDYAKLRAMSADETLVSLSAVIRAMDELTDRFAAASDVDVTAMAIDALQAIADVHGVRPSALLDAIAALQADARRYAMTRDLLVNGWEDLALHDGILAAETEEEFDAAIDAALAQQEQTNTPKRDQP